MTDVSDCTIIKIGEQCYGIVLEKTILDMELTNLVHAVYLLFAYKLYDAKMDCTWC